MRRAFRGIGAIFMLHHVMPGGGLASGFAPNRGLEITPEFLDCVIGMLKKRGCDLVNLDEAMHRTQHGGRPFAVFTLDDGYRDNLIHARPVFQRHGCPYTIYVAPAIADGTCELWWRGLELAIARNAKVMGDIDGAAFDLPCGTVAEKWQAWSRLYWPVRRLEQHEQRQWIASFCARHRVDLPAVCRDAAMNWDELRQVAADPLCTIGAHTINHYNVRALGHEEALHEMAQSAGRIEQEIGRRPLHLSYPYGDESSAGPRDFDLARQAGFITAVTTRKGMIFRGHNKHPTALPRFSLAGEYQKPHYVEALLSGVPFALFNRFRAVNVG